MQDSRNNPGHTNDVFIAIIIQCSMRNCDRSYKGDDEESRKLYYCTECESMHHSNSRIGKFHKKYQNGKRIEDE